MAIALQSVSKWYGELPVVRDVELNVAPGELFVLLESGPVLKLVPAGDAAADEDDD